MSRWIQRGRVAFAVLMLAASAGLLLPPVPHTHGTDGCRGADCAEPGLEARAVAVEPAGSAFCLACVLGPRTPAELPLAIAVRHAAEPVAAPAVPPHAVADRPVVEPEARGPPDVSLV